MRYRRYSKKIKLVKNYKEDNRKKLKITACIIMKKVIVQNFL